MINERKEPTIRRLLESSGAAAAASARAPGAKTEANNGSSKSNLNYNYQLRFEPMIEFIGDRQSSLEADLKVCQLIESGVQGVLGPLEGASIAHVQSICDNLEIPYFELRPQIGTPSAATLSGSLSSALGAPTKTAPQAWQLTVSRPSLFNKAQQSHPLDGVQASTLANGVMGPPARRLAQRNQADPLAGDQTSDNTLSPHARPSSTHGLSSSTSASARQFAGPESAGADGWSSARLLVNGLARPGQQQQQQQFATGEREDLTLNLYPPAHLLSSAYIDLIYAWNWSSFAIVYDTGSSMIKLQDLLKESGPSASTTNRWQIKLFQFESALASSDSPQGPALEPNQHNHKQGQSAPETSPGSLSFRDIFWRIKSSGEQNILLDVKTEHLYDALKQAQQVGCMTEHFSYLITSLDLHTIDLEDFKYSRTRISAFSIVQVTTRLSQLDQYEESDASAGRQQQPAWSAPDERAQGRSKSAQDGLLFDREYLEKLGVRLGARPAAGNSAAPAPSSRSAKQASYRSQSTPVADNADVHLRNNKHRLSPSVVLERQGAFMDPPSELFGGRRDQAASSPLSMGVLPNPDRDSEQRLFEFFVEQQELESTRPRLSTSSAILHDSLLLFARALAELDPSGGLLARADSPAGPSIGAQLGHEDLRAGQAKDGLTWDSGKAECSPDAQPWSLGSSLVNYMRLSSFVGLTGPILFDQRGLRSEFRLEMVSMAPNVGLIKVGEWWANRSELARQPDGWPDADQTGARNYEQLSKSYELQLRRYKELLASGKSIRVPYTRKIQPRWPRAGSSQRPRSWEPPTRLDLATEPAGLLQVNDIIFERLFGEQVDQVDTLIVTTKLSQPYFMLKETPNKLEGNDQYEGFAVDLIHELSKLVNFKYRWREVADKKYGSKEVLANGSVVWNGMIGEIIRGQADLAIVDLTITAQRGEAVDFTLPFMNTGISILFKKPTTKVTTLFSFLSPFSTDVWAYVLAAYCGISAILYLVGHLSPYEWSQAHLCVHSMRMQEEHERRIEYQCEDTVEPAAKGKQQQQQLLHNQFSLLNSFWFTIGSLMQQGSDLTPRSMSTRTVAGIWYFFTLIMISSYTANLAAFLTVEKVVYPIENVRDLSEQQEIRYGCVESGSTCVFFQDSQIDTYKRISDNMRKFKTYVRSNDDGQKRVEEGKFAFFMESTSIEYIVERNCNLTQIGGLLDTKGYGLATSKKSRFRRPYRTLLSEGILHLQETGMLHVLKNRWWKERRGGGTCTDDAKGGGVTELSLANVGGVFVVLLGGLAISFLVAIAEFMWRARHSGSSRDGVCDQMMSDLKFALACKSSTKPAAKVLKSRRKRLEQDGRLAEQQWHEAAKLRGQAPACSQARRPARQQMSSAPLDPVVMHAMLNMLMQQRPEPLLRNNQPLPGSGDEQPSTCHPAATPDELARRRRLLASQHTTIDDFQASLSAALQLANGRPI